MSLSRNLLQITSLESSKHHKYENMNSVTFYAIAAIYLWAMPAAEYSEWQCSCCKLLTFLQNASVSSSNIIQTIHKIQTIIWPHPDNSCGLNQTSLVASFIQFTCKWQHSRSSWCLIQTVDVEFTQEIHVTLVRQFMWLHSGNSCGFIQAIHVASFRQFMWSHPDNSSGLIQTIHVASFRQFMWQ